MATLFFIYIYIYFNYVCFLEGCDGNTVLWGNRQRLAVNIARMFGIHFTKRN